MYRSFFTERRIEPPMGFIDGDLIETLTEMPRELVAEIIDGLRIRRISGTMGEESKSENRKPEVKIKTILAEPAKVPEVMKLIEDLAQIH